MLLLLTTNLVLHQYQDCQSFLATIQFFSNKSQVTLRRCELSFYSHHLTALKVLEKKRGKHVIEDKAVVAYFPLSYDSTNVDDFFPSLNAFQEIMDVPKFCNLFTNLWIVLWKRCFPLHFPDLRPLRLMSSDIFPQYGASLHCIYTEAEDIFLQERGEYDQYALLELWGSERNICPRNRILIAKPSA